MTLPVFVTPIRPASVFCEAAVAQQGPAQTASAHQDGVVGVVVAQGLLDVADEQAAVIADFRASAVGYAGQVLAHLHVAHAQGVGQSGGGNVGGGVLRLGPEVFQIDRQTPEYGFGEFFHHGILAPESANCDSAEDLQSL